MRNFKLIASLSLVLFSGQVFAQNSGFIGKKNIVSLDTRLFMPVTYNFRHLKNERYKYKDKNGTLVPDRNLISRGLNVSLGRTLSNQVAFHMQFSVLDYKFAMEAQSGGGGSLNNASVLKSTFFRGRAIGIMPIIEFTNSGGILPIGLSNQVGLGFNTHRPLKKDYLLLVNDFSETSLLDEEDLFDYDKYRIKSYSLMYKINLRLAINRSLLFNVGIRYNLNFTQGFFGLDNSTEQFVFTENDYRQMVQKTQVVSLVSLETGLSFVF